MKLEEIINEQILNPKRTRFVNNLVKIIGGNEDSLERCEPWTKYYEVWYYNPFDFKYIFLAKDNLVVNIFNENDVEKIRQIASMGAEPETGLFQISNSYRGLELEFVSNCWEEMESILNTSERCFWVEHGSLRVYDVNNRQEISEQQQEKILEEEGLL